jgi:ribosomal protein S18 acetylase RimI-like enzyme
VSLENTTLRDIVASRPDFGNQSGTVIPTLELRPAREADFPAIQVALDGWWTLPSHTTAEAKRERALLVPRVWLQHFASSSLIAERVAGGASDSVLGFLIGFHSFDRAEESYIHFVGVRPDARKERIGRTLYERFFEEARRHGRGRVRAITSPSNEVSLAFHLALGFAIEPGTRERDGIAVKPDYDGPGFDRIAFVRELG